jgi:predicted dehydrogenase
MPTKDPRPTPATGTPAPLLPLRFGVIGCGAISQVTHLPMLPKFKGVELAALCDSDGAKVRTLAQRFGVPEYFTDVDDLFSDVELDAVIVATPNHLHEPHILSALKAKCDVLSERPLALTSKGVDKLIAAAGKAGRKLVASTPTRFRADVQALASFLHNGELGKVHGIRAGAYHQRGSAEGWRTRRAEAGGGALLEFGYSLVDLALWLTDFPEPQRVSAHWVRGRGQAAVEDTIVVLLTCANGMAVTFNVTWQYVGEKDRWAFEVLASSGSARLSPLRVVKDFHGRPTDLALTGAATREPPLLQSHRAELAHFVAMLRGEVAYEPPVDQLNVMRIIEAAYKSAEEEREVRL